LSHTLEPLDKAKFELRLNGAVAVVPFEEAVQRILLPLQRRVGDLWHQGQSTIAVEHYVIKLVQQKMISVAQWMSILHHPPD
jgi:MerR family transcriptional regulator, light-induced transcriptional regulator